MTRGGALGAVSAFFIAVIAAALLVPMSRDDFFDIVECAYLVHVEEVVPWTSKQHDEMQGESLFNQRATLKIEEVISTPVSKCEPESPLRHFLFSSGIHSSHPAPGERALFFPRNRESPWVEAVYGRSFWPVVSAGGEEMVQINWRNEFLVHPLSLRSGETALISLPAVKRLVQSGGAGDTPRSGFDNEDAFH